MPNVWKKAIRVAAMIILRFKWIKLSPSEHKELCNGMGGMSCSQIPNCSGRGVYESKEPRVFVANYSV